MQVHWRVGRVVKVGGVMSVLLLVASLYIYWSLSMVSPEVAPAAERGQVQAERGIRSGRQLTSDLEDKLVLEYWRIKEKGKAREEKEGDKLVGELWEKLGREVWEKIREKVGKKVLAKLRKKLRERLAEKLGKKEVEIDSEEEYDELVNMAEQEQEEELDEGKEENEGMEREEMDHNEEEKSREGQMLDMRVAVIAGDAIERGAGEVGEIGKVGAGAGAGADTYKSRRGAGAGGHGPGASSAEHKGEKEEKDAGVGIGVRGAGAEAGADVRVRGEGAEAGTDVRVRRAGAEAGVEAGAGAGAGAGDGPLPHTLRVYEGPGKLVLMSATNSTHSFFSELLQANRSNSLVGEVRVSSSAPLNQTLLHRLHLLHPLHPAPAAAPDNVSCTNLITWGDRAPYPSGRHTVFHTDSQLVSLTTNCTRYNHGYVLDVSEAERDFPLAFSLLVYKDAGQVERLLKAIYRPHNYYCIHVDKKTDTTTRLAIAAIARCLPNVFLAHRSVDVRWGRPTVLDAEVICMGDLMDAKKQEGRKRWKYFINLTGQEFPLKTNWELVQILRNAYRGASDVDATVSKLWYYRWQYLKGYHISRDGKLRHNKNKAPPHPYTMTKGSTHVALTYEFVRFILYSPLSHDLYTWLLPTEVADETFFGTLHNSPHLKVPSAYTGPHNEENVYHSMARYKRWDNMESCPGRRQRQICLGTMWDLHNMVHSPHFFINKFESSYQPLAYHCLHSWHHAKVLEELTAQRQGLTLHMDTRGYQQLPWVRHHL